MHIVSRILFWLSLAGLGLALVAPILSRGASWGEAEAGVVIGLLFTFVFGIASIATVSGRDASGAVDPFERSAQRRSGGIAYSLLALLVMGVLGAVAFTRASSDHDVTLDSRLPRYEQTYALDVAADASNGMTSGILAFVGAAISFVSLVSFLAERPLRPTQPWAPPGFSSPYSGYDPHAHVRALYGPTPAPMPTAWQPQAPGSVSFQGQA